MKLTEYKGYDINIAESSGEFQGEKDHSYTDWFDTLAKLRAKIDKIVKTEDSQGYPIPVYHWSSGWKGYGFIKGKLTSYNSEENAVWFVSNKGDREKIGLRHIIELYVMNETNNALISQIESKESQIEMIRKDIEPLKKQLVIWEKPNK